MRRLLVALIAPFMAVLMLGAGITTAAADPPSALKLAPDKTLNFGAVPVGTQVFKEITILNRTKGYLYYNGANWPNLQHPGLAYPFGIWNWSGPPVTEFPCFVIAPKSQCSLTFAFMPAAPGPFSSSAFAMTYNTSADATGTDYVSNDITMRGVGF